MLFTGGDEGGRTPYLLNAIQALYQLSYTPKGILLYHYKKKTRFCQTFYSKKR